ncbi:hypothetical protein [Magnetospirillum sp. 64-120]|uniref:hypothetical protein n=1 Tax=Magnetospirillum sp. 64-120 TaxID=1895778 RepID=UPI00092A8CBA|nr:hypothetical protein [Magnetospirillum sp. 64-120]OJX76817.1 MAG: hypothetical protein BGO92_11075 [Magnetospirillum sp. 64-120]
MLLNNVHLLPDRSGALVWPARQLLAVADPIDAPQDRAAPALATEAVRRLAALTRQRRPRSIVWLGKPLMDWEAALPLCERRELQRLTDSHEIHWVTDQLELAPLTFRIIPGPSSIKGGEVVARPNPLARCDGQVWPAFVIDGRRLALPAFGPRLTGTEVMSPAFLSAFRRPFQALMLVHGKVVTRPRSRLETPP